MMIRSSSHIFFFVVGGIIPSSMLVTSTRTYDVGNSPQYIVFDDNNGWVTNWDDNTVAKLSNSGSTLGTYSTGVGGPMGVAVDGSNNIWVVNEDGSVTKLSDTGSVLGTFTVGGYPTKIAFDNDGNAWVTSYLVAMSSN
jgi:DNA-binding beta-propeller fold protein YncE